VPLASPLNEYAPELLVVVVAPPLSVNVTPPPYAEGVTVPEMLQSPGTILKAHVWLMPLAVAVMMAVWVVETAETVAVKAVVLLPPAMVTLAGTATFALLLDSETVNPPRGAGPLRVTTQAAEPGVLILDGEQDNPESDAAVVKFMGVLTLCPLNVAVSAAVWLELMLPAVTVNPPLEAPLATVTLAGSESKVVLLDNATLTEVVAG
jgi:hypothetical protein